MMLKSSEGMRKTKQSQHSSEIIVESGALTYWERIHEYQKLQSHCLGRSYG
jgi:hypothetical protein